MLFHLFQLSITNSPTLGFLISFLVSYRWPQLEGVERTWVRIPLGQLSGFKSHPVH